MIAVSNDFKNAMKQPIKELDAYIKLDENNKLTSADDLISFKISCETNMCKTAMRKLEGKYLGNHNLLGQWVHVGFGVKLLNDTFEYLDYGSFLITEINTSKDSDVTTIIGHDKMINSMKQYTPLNVTYPINLYNYTKAICSRCGLTLGNETFTHANWLINKELWENIQGITYRDILVQIAQVTASTCIISNDDKIYFKSINNTEETLTYDNMKKLKLSPIYGEINSVVLSRTPQEDNIYMRDEASILTNGLTEYKIENNEIIDKDRDNAMIPIYNALHGISYYPFETTTEGLGWYEIADSFNIVDDSNNVYNTTLFNFSITIDGGIIEILKSVADTKTQTQYQYASVIGKRIKNTEIIVDKQEQVIKQVVSDVEEQNSKIVSIEENINGIQLKVNQSIGLTTNKSDYNKIKLESAKAGPLLNLSLTGNLELLYFGDNFYFDNDLYLPDSYLIVENEEKVQRLYHLPINHLYQLEVTDDEGNTSLVSDELVYEVEATDNNKEILYTAKLKVIRRIGVDLNENKFVTGVETIETLNCDVIELFEGTNYIYMQSFDNLRYKITYATENEYTKTFATKEELNSEIKLTNSNIKLEVSEIEKILENEVKNFNSQFSLTAKEISSKVSAVDGGVQLASLIRQTAELIFLQANNFGWTSTNSSMTLDGKLTCNNAVVNNATVNGTINSNNGNLGGWNLSSSGLSNGNLFIRNNGYSNIYTYADMVIIENYLLGKINLNATDITHYDLNGDGVVNSADLLQMRKMIIGG